MKHPAIDVPVVDHGKAFRRIRLGFRPGRLAIMAKVPRRLVRHRPDSYPGFSRLVLKLGQLAVGLVLLEVPGKPGFHQLMGHILSLRDNPCDEAAVAVRLLHLHLHRDGLSEDEPGCELLGPGAERLAALGAVDALKADPHGSAVTHYVDGVPVYYSNALRGELGLRDKGLAKKQTDKI